jgi:general secretion pathway protein C
LNDNRRMLARWWSFAVWALVAGSALFWGFRLFVKAPQVPVQATTVDLGAGARGDLTRVFGPDPVLTVAAAEPEPVADSRFQLIGVVSPRGTGHNSQGVALIAVDGKPAKAYRVGSIVDGQTTLQSVRARGAALGPRDGAVQVALEIAPPAVATTGSLANPSVPVAQRAPTMPQGLTRSVPPGGNMRQPNAAPLTPGQDMSGRSSPHMVPVEQ